MEKSERQLLEEISNKLGQLLGITAASGKTEDQQIQILRNMDFDWKFIGMVTGMTPDAARMRFAKTNKDYKNGKIKANPK